MIFFLTHSITRSLIDLYPQYVSAGAMPRCQIARYEPVCVKVEQSPSPYKSSDISKVFFGIICATAKFSSYANFGEIR